MFEPKEVTDYPDYLFLNITTQACKVHPILTIKINKIVQ